MTRRQWERISKIFNETSKLDPSQRRAYLNRVCADASIRAQVESLLKHHTPEPFMGVLASIDGKILGHYRMIEPIGRGSMGEVYKAQDLNLDRFVAAKLLAPWVTGAPGFRERLVQEAKSASALNHENIVIVHEIAREECVDFIVMEYIIGKTLQQAVPAGGLPVELALDYAIQIGDALYTAHTAGILHGDLKPANIMVTQADRIKLLDFGLARALEPEPGPRPQGEPFGTLAYMSPERIRNRRNDASSEIFTVGLVMHQMLGGKHPFGTGTPNEIAEAIQHHEPDLLLTTVPAQLTKIIYRCLEKNPADRYQSMKDLVIELWACEENRNDTKLPSVADRTVSTVKESDEVPRVLAIAAQVSYNNAVRSREALEALTGLLKTGISITTRKTVCRALKEVILTIEPNADGISPSVRHIRRLTFDTLKLFAEGDFRQLFSDRDLERLDLGEIDFSGLPLAGLSFRECFLIHADFRRANLKQCSLVGTWLRNVRFEEADLDRVDLTGADWFNAIGLTEHQLASALQDTVMPCPSDVNAFLRFLSARYRYSFEGWPPHVQKQIMATWGEYLRPGGLRDLVLTWQKKSV